MNQEKEREKTQAWINRFKSKATLASRAQSKVKMLEEVIMNLQLTVTNVQSFAMETNLSLTKLQKPTNTISSMPIDIPVSVPVPELNNTMITGTETNTEFTPTFTNINK